MAKHNRCDDEIRERLLRLEKQKVESQPAPPRHDENVPAHYAVGTPGASMIYTKEYQEALTELIWASASMSL